MLTKQCGHYNVLVMISGDRVLNFYFFTSCVIFGSSVSSSIALACEEGGECLDISVLL